MSWENLTLNKILGYKKREVYDVIPYDVIIYFFNGMVKRHNYIISNQYYQIDNTYEFIDIDNHSYVYAASQIFSFELIEHRGD